MQNDNLESIASSGGDTLLTWTQQYTDPQFIVSFGFGLIIIFFLSRQRFNTPSYVTKPLGPVANVKPSSLTTADRSRNGFALYLFLLLIIFILLCMLGPQIAVLLLGRGSVATYIDTIRWAW